MATRAISAEDFVRRLDVRQMPRYTFGEAGQYLGLPESTIRSWFAGTTYGSQPNLSYFRPILIPAAPGFLSFFDIAQAHVLMAFKKKGIRTEHIRVIVQSLEAEYPDARYPLLGKNFYTFGRQIIIKQAGKRLSLSRHRQLGLKVVMDKFLARLELDANKMPIRFSPIRFHEMRGKRFFVIDPTLSEGRPVIRGTGIAAEIISKRRASGESVASLAKDYRVTRRAIQEAVKYFPPKAKAA